jgi:hypothetical protein
MKILKQLKADNKINIQEYKTYKGQVLSGNEEGCRKGLKRKGLI